MILGAVVFGLIALALGPIAFGENSDTVFLGREISRTQNHSDATARRIDEAISAFREALGIERWVVFGGSWGSTLALAYAETHPERVRALVLRGIFLLRPHELRWFYQEGASFLFPDRWEAYLAPIPEAERDDLIAAYHHRLVSPDRAVRLEAARAWATWEGATSRLLPDQSLVDHYGEDEMAEAFSRIENHYFVNGGFFTHPDQLLDGVDRIRQIPAVIVQGRYDIVCPPVTADALARAWPEARYVIVPDAGHSALEPGIRAALVNATESFRLSSNDADLFAPRFPWET